jgi:hypothetical protein
MDRRVIVFAVLALTGCAAHRPVRQTYRLVKQGSSEVLIPPGLRSPDVARRTFETGALAGSGPCPTAGGILIHRHGKRLRVTVTRDALLSHSPGWLTAWSAGLEEQGCIGSGEGLRLAEQIAQSLPLDLTTAFSLLHTGETQGQVDIDAHTRLEVVSPILRDGASPDGQVPKSADVSQNGGTLSVTLRGADNLIGYETAWYAVKPKADRTGFTIAPLFAERHIEGELERRPQPATNYFQFPAEASFYRLFYKAGQTEFTALVVAARARGELERRTKALDEGTASCEKLHSELCIAIPRAVGINPFVEVTVNGKPLMVPWRATVGQAIEEGGETDPGAILPRLALYKPYGNRAALVEFDRASSAVLQLILAGGERISWR